MKMVDGPNSKIVPNRAKVQEWFDTISKIQKEMEEYLTLGHYRAGQSYCGITEAADKLRRALKETKDWKESPLYDSKAL
jgi:hypothetical protein